MNTIRIALVAMAALLLLCVAAAAQELKPEAPIADQASNVSADVEVTLAPNWEVGDSYRIEQASEHQEIRRGQTQPKRTNRTLTQVEVLEATGNGYVLAATLMESSIFSSGVAGQGGADIAALLSELFEGKTMEYVTDENGVPVGLRNKEEMVGLMRAAMDGLIASKFQDPRQRQQIQAGMNQMMTADVIEAMAIKDAATFYALLGGIYQGGPAQAYDLPMQFPFSQEMIDAELHVLVRRIDDSAGTVHISTQNVPDPAQVKRAMKNWLTGVIEAQGQSVPPGFQFPDFTMQDTVHYVIDRNRMLPAEVTWERYMRMGDEVLRLDRNVFRLMPAN